jgi:hypothetical protein
VIWCLTGCGPAPASGTTDSSSPPTHADGSPDGQDSDSAGDTADPETILGHAQETVNISWGPGCHDNGLNPDGSGRTLVPSITDLSQPYVVVGKAFSDWDMPFEQLKPADNAGYMARSASASDLPDSHWMSPTGAASEAE